MGSLLLKWLNEKHEHEIEAMHEEETRDRPPGTKVDEEVGDAEVANGEEEEAMTVVKEESADENVEEEMKMEAIPQEVPVNRTTRSSKRQRK